MIRVAQAGIRGVPANFGGSETAVEEIGTRLAAEGVDVVVYCRRHKSKTDAVEYRGMRRVVNRAPDLEFSREDFEELMKVDRAAWRKEVIAHEELFIELHDHLPPEMIYERELLICKL